jgi:signal transduction histidine kinase
MPQVVEAHGGTIVAEPVEPRGARFRITLPTRPPAKAERERALSA